MSKMFSEADAFNQDLRRWNVSKVTHFIEMFMGATAFNQNLSDWHQPDKGRRVKEEAPKYDMFVDSGLSEANRPSWSTAEMYWLPDDSEDESEEQESGESEESESEDSDDS